MQVDESGQKKVTAILEDGRRFEGDILIGADGIWSKVGRPALRMHQPNLLLKCQDCKSKGTRLATVLSRNDLVKNKRIDPQQEQE